MGKVKKRASVFSFIASILLLAVLAPVFVSAETSGQDVINFLGKVKASPGNYTLVFEENINEGLERSILDFAKRFKIVKSNIDKYVSLDSANLIVIGNPEKNAIMKGLGISGDNVREVHTARGEKLLVGAKDSATLAEMVDSLGDSLVGSLEGSLGASSGKSSGESLGKGKTSGLPGSSSASPLSSALDSASKGQMETSPAASGSFYGKVEELLSPLPGSPWLWIITILTAAPVFSLIGVQTVRNKRKLDRNKAMVKNYLRACIQRGYHPQYLKQYLSHHLARRGWKQKTIDDMFSGLR
ncbi:hypothetical protein HYU14_07665 [Candidatus Woesearchaeota archaeon]|nr:hypothetical protein [Candidatus Woesearchaeota archaeon]